MINNFDEIISSAVIYAVVLSIFFIIKRKRKIKKVESIYDRFRFNYNYLIYGTLMVTALTVSVTLSFVVSDIKKFDNIAVFLLLFFLFTVFISFFYALKSRE